MEYELRTFPYTERKSYKIRSQTSLGTLQSWSVEDIDKRFWETMD